MFIIGGDGVKFQGNGAFIKLLSVCPIPALCYALVPVQNILIYPGHTFDGQGQKYWDGKGGNGGKKKPVSWVLG
jgi:hypothetical protein